MLLLLQQQALFFAFTERFVQLTNTPPERVNVRDVVRNDGRASQMYTRKRIS
jgi:hypothetical protein